MKITSCKDYEAMSQKAAQIVMDEVSQKPDLLFCAATADQDF